MICPHNPVFQRRYLQEKAGAAFFLMRDQDLYTEILNFGTRRNKVEQNGTVAAIESQWKV
jgi:hypothetical protein